MGSMMTAFSEGLTLGEDAGLDAADILEVVRWAMHCVLTSNP